MITTSFIFLTLCMSSVKLSADSCDLVDTVRDRKIDSKDTVVTTISIENVGSPEECYRTCCDLSEPDGCTTAEYVEKKNDISCKLYKCESEECPTKKSLGKVIYYIGYKNQSETTTEKALTTPTQDTVSTDSTLTASSKTPTTQLSTSTGSTSNASSSVTEASMTSESPSTQSTSPVMTTENGQMFDNSTKEQGNVSSATSTMVFSSTTQSSFTTSTLDGPGNETSTGPEPEDDGPGFVLIAVIAVGVVVALVICVLAGKWLHGYLQRRNYTEMDK